jgi:hypothetical protein
MILMDSRQRIAFQRLIQHQRLIYGAEINELVTDWLVRQGLAHRADILVSITEAGIEESLVGIRDIVKVSRDWALWELIQRPGVRPVVVELAQAELESRRKRAQQQVK